MTLALGVKEEDRTVLAGVLRRIGRTTGRGT
jgi:hypothetical protein